MKILKKILALTIFFLCILVFFFVFFLGIWLLVMIYNYMTGRSEIDNGIILVIPLIIEAVGIGVSVFLYRLTVKIWDSTLKKKKPIKMREIDDLILPGN